MRWLLGLVTFLTTATAQAQRVDVSGHRADHGAQVRATDDSLTLDWPIAPEENGRLVLNLRQGAALVSLLGITRGREDAPVPLLRDVAPAFFVTVGSRENPPGRPAGMSVFNVFFDSPANRPFQTHQATLRPANVRVWSEGRSEHVAIDGLSAGPFAGSLWFTVYPGTRLVHVEAVMKTQEDRRAFFYDAGLVAQGPLSQRVAWMDTDGTMRRREFTRAPDQSLAVRHRTIVAESDHGGVALFPPPHQFFFPRDYTDNLRHAWFGQGHRDLEGRPGLGIRQTEKGGGNFSPWFNAPPDTDQRMGLFLLLTREDADGALREVLKFTRGDRFPDLAGHRTFTSHWHMAVAVAAMKEIEKGGPRTTPDFIKMFRDMNVNIVHLAEFHGDGHPQDPGPLRLPELDAMFAECRRLSDERLVFLPGEEANVHYGAATPVQGQHPGHWVYFFPRPVHWIMKRGPSEPFVEEHPRYGKLYRVGDGEEMTRLLKEEHGLAWTAHARIKASNFAPDHYRDQDFFRAETWLGAAWKAMPADLSRPRLGERALDLLDDMSNWGARKQVIGEVDVFKLDHTHELYGHMNINYVKLDDMPSHDKGWGPLLDALRAGRFFTTTGEVLIERFTREDAREVRAEVSWTFPPRFAEIISGDGSNVFRERVDLSGEPAFSRKTIVARPDLQGRRWVRLEVWDVAANGAFTQPIWLD